MSYIVTLESNGEAWYLRSTILTSDIERATTYETPEAAAAAIDKAKRFHKARVIKALRIVEIAPSV